MTKFQRLLSLLLLVPGLAWGASISAPPFSAGSGLTLPGQSIGTTAGTAIQARAPIDIATRVPTANDGSALGYAVGSWWYYPTSIYSALAVGSGNAVWQPYSTITQPSLLLDTVASAAAAYSLDQLTTAYVANKAIDVLRASDSTTTTIGFVGGKFDSATASAFCAATTCTVSKWYDQSGNLADLAQATTAQQPQLVYLQSMGWVVMFNSKQFNNANVLKNMTATLASSIAPINASLFITGQHQASVTSSEAAILGSVGYYGSSLFVPGLATNSIHSNAVVPTTPSVISYVPTNSNVTYRANNLVSVIPQSLSNTPSTSFTLGGTATTAYTSIAMRTVVLWGRQMNATDVSNATALMMMADKIVPQTLTDTVIYDGDSITFGVGSPTQQAWPVQTVAALIKRTNSFNLGQPGVTLASPGKVDETGWYTPICLSGMRNIVSVIMLGTNDISAGSSASTTYANLLTYVAGVRAACPSAKIIISTLTPRATQPQAFFDYCDLIRNNWRSFADGLIDYQANANLTNEGSNVAFFPDGTHPSVMTSSYMVPLAAQQINAWLTIP